MSDREPTSRSLGLRTRKRDLLGVALFTGLVFGLMTIGVGLHLIERHSHQTSSATCSSAYR